MIVYNFSVSFSFSSPSGIMFRITPFIAALLLWTDFSIAESHGKGTSDESGGGLLSFLDAVDHQRRSFSHQYSYIFNKASNFTRVDLPFGDKKRKTSVLPSISVHEGEESSAAKEDWIDLGSSFTNTDTDSFFSFSSASDSSWYNPLYYIWYMTHMFHTTTVTLSCNSGGEHGDPDLDAFDGCNLESLRIDVNRDDHSICQLWENVDLTEEKEMTSTIYKKASFALKNNRFPTKTDLKNNKKTKEFKVKPGESLSNLVTKSTPPWLVGVTGADKKLKTLFGFCLPCNNNEGGAGCGSPQPKSCTKYDESYGDTILRNMGFTASKSEEGDDSGSSNRPTLCTSDIDDTKRERTLLHPYSCNDESCKFILSPYSNPEIRVVDVNNKPTTYWIEVSENDICLKETSTNYFIFNFYIFLLLFFFLSLSGLLGLLYINIDNAGTHTN